MTLTASSHVLSDPNIAPPRPTHSQAVAALVDFLDQHPQVDCPVTHRFSPGVYTREITMPAGSVCVGHKHKTRHQNIALTGRAIVTIDGVTTEVVAPFVFESAPGGQKMFKVLEDLCWLTIHANPDDITDILAIEELIFDLPQEIKESGIPLDDYRMTHRSPCLDS
jgi:hypothetical protein